MDSKKSFNLKSFMAANADHVVSGVDYVRIIYKDRNLPTDFVLCFAQLFCPKFRMLDGKVFIDELFVEDRYQELLNSGCSVSEAQFWINLLEITGLFDDFSNEQAVKFAELLTRSWNAKLRLESTTSTEQARVVVDNNTGEIFVTIGQLN